MRIAIGSGSDFCPVGSIGVGCQNADAEAVFGDLLKDLHQADLAGSMPFSVERNDLISPWPARTDGPADA